MDGRLNVSQITKNYPTRNGTISVLKDCSFQLQPGQSLAVVGPSGSGKSTLLSILGTLEPPTSGTYELGGVSPLGLAEHDLAAFRRDRIGFIFQDHHLLPQCGVLENVLIPFLADGTVSPSQKEGAKELLNRFGLGGRLNHRPAELSGGERQRVAIARALIRRPAFVLADEPTGNLDRTMAATIAELIQSLLEAPWGDRNDKMMLILVTHDRELARRMDFVHEIDQGVLQNITVSPHHGGKPTQEKNDTP